jgi:septum formation protein
VTPRPLVLPDGPPVVLASRSAARAGLLRAAGVDFAQVDAPVDEAAVREGLAAEGVRAEDAATVLAELKAQRGADQVGPGAIVLGGDQILELDGRWLEKPADRAAARAQLLALRGRRHRLVSSVVAFRGGGRVWHHVAAASVRVRPFGDAFLEAYFDAAGDDVLGSVGVYHLEGLGAQLMDRVEGDFFTVLGLPLLPLLQFLREQGVLRA